MENRARTNAAIVCLNVLFPRFDELSPYEQNEVKIIRDNINGRYSYGPCAGKLKWLEKVRERVEDGPST